MRIVYYTQVCAPCEDYKYHYWRTMELLHATGMAVNERYIAALPAWQKEAQAFNAPLPIVYCPDKNKFLSIGENYDENQLVAFLDSLK